MSIDPVSGLTLSREYFQAAPETQAQVLAYLAQLTPIEKQAYTIAQRHLETSFHIIKSNGFQQWLKRSQQQQQQQKPS